MPSPWASGWIPTHGQQLPPQAPGVRRDPAGERSPGGRPPCCPGLHQEAMIRPSDDLLSQMDIKAQAETMHTLVRARNLYQEDRSVDVGVFAGFLRHSAELLAALGGPLEAWADWHGRARHATGQSAQGCRPPEARGIDVITMTAARCGPVVCPPGSLPPGLQAAAVACCRGGQPRSPGNALHS